MTRIVAAIIFISLFYNIGYAQSTFSYGITLQTEINKTKSVENVPQGIGVEVDENTVGFGYAIGGLLEWEHPNKIFIRTSLSVEHSTFKKSSDATLVNSAQGQFYRPTNFYEELYMFALSGEVRAGIKFGKGERLKYVASMGLYFSVPVHEDTEYMISSEGLSPYVGMEEQIVRFEDYYLGFIAAFGIEYSLSEKLVLGIEPYLKLAKKEFVYIYSGPLGSGSRFDLMESNYDLGLTVNLKF